MKKIGIINASPFYQDTNGVYYMQASELKSLEMFDFFKEVFLYKPRKYAAAPPKGWKKVINGFICKEICNVESSRLERKVAIQSNIRNYISDVDVFYFRMPNYEAYWAWEIIRQNIIPFFTELHGDWGEAILNEDNNSFIRKLSRWYRAKKATSIVKKISNESLFVMTIGHALTKYIDDKSKPTYVTTNHLLNEKYYIESNQKRLINEAFKILFVGDVQVRKGLMYLFKSFKLLVEDGLNVQLDIVGSGASEVLLKEYTAKNNLNDKVTFHGRVPHGPILFSYFKKADVFVLPSVGAEGVPRVTHEAMAMSCPVIATDVGSVAWQLENNSGILVPPRDEKSIYIAIKRLLNSTEEYQKLVKNGYRRSLDFTYEKQQKNIQEFIMSILNDYKA